MPSKRPTTGQLEANRRAAAVACLEALRQQPADQWPALLPQIRVLRDPCFLQPLSKLLRDKEPARRRFGVLGLGALRDPRALEPLCALLEELQPMSVPMDRILAVAVADALGEIGDDRATPALARMLAAAPATGSGALAARLIDALGTIAQQGGPAALLALQDVASGSERRQCAQALQEIGVAFWHCPEALPAPALRLLVDRLDDEATEVRQAALWALEDLAGLGCEPATRALKERRRAERKAGAARRAASRPPDPSG